MLEYWLRDMIKTCDSKVSVETLITYVTIARATFNEFKRYKIYMDELDMQKVCGF